MNRLPDHNRLRICVVGAGPRGLSVLERLCANARVLTPRRPVEIHLVDPCRPGAGRVWRTDQSRRLLMNTVASQITLFTDESVRVDGPVEPGPSLYEWARRLADGEAEYAGPAEYEEPTVREARALGPDAYPTRALYGHYLEWVFRRVVRGAPAGLTVRTHTGRAVAVDDTDGTRWQEVRLADGTRLGHLDAVVLTQGHVPARMSAPERELAGLAVDHGLAYVPPANPADLDLDRLAPPGEPVLLRGLGLNFFDHMALLTEGRGGTFVRTAHGLVYRASGREPLLCAGSRRGVPYHARGENEKGAHGRRLPRLLTPDRVARLRAAGPLDFRRELWPLIAKEVEGVYYEALLACRVSAGEVEEFAVRWPGAAPGVEEDRLLTAAGVGAAERWDWKRLDRPYGARRFTGHADFTRWLLDHLRADVHEARRGNVSGPLKAALDVLRDLRNEIRLAVDHGGLEGRSHRDDLDRWYTPLNAFLSIGPPALRIEQMTALIEAGVLRVAGPGTRVVAGPDGFALESAVPGVRMTGRLLVEARLPEPDVRRTADPLLRHLLATGQGRPFRVPARNPAPPGNPAPTGHPASYGAGSHGTGGYGTGSHGTGGHGAGSYETGGLEVTGRPYHVVDAAGRAHPRRFAHGVPTESVHWVTAAGIRPGVDSVTLGDSDAVARAVLLPATAPTAATAAPAAPATSTVVAPGRATGLAEVTA